MSLTRGIWIESHRQPRESYTGAQIGDNQMNNERERCEYCGREDSEGYKDGLCEGCYEELKNAHKDDDYPRRGPVI